MNQTKIFVGLTDKYDSEVRAMLSAMYSRSYASIETRLPDSEESIQKHKEKLNKFYVNWGHKSVGQLASTDIYIEGVSMLAEKAIQNHPLYNGQSSSTRYIDFSNQPFVSPNKEINHWQEIFRTFYIKALPLVLNKVRTEFPFESQPDGTVQTTWENTTKARAFDICRGLLPAGCTTNVAFTGTFDTINDHFGEMLYHPCKEMRDIAIYTLTELKKKYPYASMHINDLIARNSYMSSEHFYQKLHTVNTPSMHSAYDEQYIVGLNECLVKRKKYEKLPKFVADKFRLVLNGALDFGSYRDIHRHRNGCIGMEVLGIERGFHPFYINGLTEELRHELINIHFAFKIFFNNEKDNFSKYDLQYCVPMGYQVGIDYRCDINQAIYIMELRSNKTVHQTLRKLVHEWVNIFKSQLEPKLNFKGECQIYADMDEDNFSLRRGTQTFTEDV